MTKVGLLHLLGSPAREHLLDIRELTILYLAASTGNVLFGGVDSSKVSRTPRQPSDR